MRLAVSGQRSAVSSQRCILICLLLIAYCLPACSIPNLEEPECTQARDTVKQFYSWYIGISAAELEKQPEKFRKYMKYISPSFLEDQKNRETDPLLLTNDWPKAFRVGSCKVVDPGKVEIQVLLFWKDDKRSEQRELNVEAVKQGDAWLIDNVNNH